MCVHVMHTRVTQYAPLLAHAQYTVCTLSHRTLYLCICMQHSVHNFTAYSPMLVALGGISRVFDVAIQQCHLAEFEKRSVCVRHCWHSIFRIIRKFWPNFLCYSCSFRSRPSPLHFHRQADGDLGKKFEIQSWGR